MIDLFRPFMSPTARAAVNKTLTPDADGRLYIGEGPRVAEFEAAFAKLVGATEPVIAVNSCTSALDLAFHLCGIGPGDEVISTPMTCSATNTGLVNRGARIIWADVDPVTGLIDPDDVLRKRTDKTKAIVAVDWAGRMCDYDDLYSAGAGWDRDIPVIRDAAHSLLAESPFYNIPPSYVAFSFQAIKHLTTGDGGALITPRDQMARARLLKWYGFDRTSKQSFRCDQRLDEAGYKYHMNDINASIGLANLPHARWVVEQHRRNAAWYHENLKGLPGLTLPPSDPESSWWLYSILVEDRDAFIAAMADGGVETSPVHSRCDIHPAFQRACANPGDALPGVDHFARHQVSIPVHWALTPSNREHIAQTVVTSLRVASRSGA